MDLARGLLPRPVLRERAGVRVISSTRCSGDSDHQVLATPEHRVCQVTLTLPSPGVPGEGRGATCDHLGRPAGRPKGQWRARTDLIEWERGGGHLNRTDT